MTCTKLPPYWQLQPICKIKNYKKGQPRFETIRGLMPIAIALKEGSIESANL